MQRDTTLLAPNQDKSALNDVIPLPGAVSVRLPETMPQTENTQPPASRDYFLRQDRATTEPTATFPPVALLSIQGQRANRVFTCHEWTMLCEHLHNGNESTTFVIGFRDNEKGERVYYKSKSHPSAKAISWAWSSINEKAKRKLAYVPYSCNASKQSRWGGLDFDAHDGNAGRAQRHALAAFQALLNHRDLAVILESSGSGGWHVWAISQHFHPISYWVKLLKAVAAKIDAPIEPGVCEIFPPDSLPTKYGKGMRAPGCWNPGTDSFSEIYWHNCTPLLAILAEAAFLSSSTGTDFPERKKQVSLSSPPQQEVGGLYHLWDRKWSSRFAIKAERTRNDLLGSLVGTVFYQVGHDMAKKLATAQFAERKTKTKSAEAKHLEQFEAYWKGLENRWLAALTESERAAYGKLSTPNERDAFRIIRSFQRKAMIDAKPDFPVARDNLAARLGITPKGAAWLRDGLTADRIIQRTKDYQANRAPARYRWSLEFVMDSENVAEFAKCA